MMKILCLTFASLLFSKILLGQTNTIKNTRIENQAAVLVQNVLKESPVIDGHNDLSYRENKTVIGKSSRNYWTRTKGASYKIEIGTSCRHS